MKIGYLFIANGRVLPIEQYQSKEPVPTGSFETVAFAASQVGWKLYQGINRFYAEELNAVDYDITFYDQNIYRNVFDLKNNYKGYVRLCKMLEKNPSIQNIHCNTPIGGVIGRLCGKRYNKIVIYTAHGFHFYKGASVFNRTIFKWIEMWLAHYTDVLITINREDYDAACKFKLNKGGKLYYVPGVGIDTKIFDNVKINKIEKFKELGISPYVKLGIVVGDLNDNKNVETLIRALPDTLPDFHLLVCGIGIKERYLKRLSDRLNVSERVHFLGFRKDIKELYAISDIFLSASKREGLPRSTMEAMGMGLPCIVSKIRGNIDLIDENKGGRLINPTDIDGFAESINILLADKNTAIRQGQYNLNKVKEFSVDVVKQRMLDIFNNLQKDYFVNRVI